MDKICLLLFSDIYHIKSLLLKNWCIISFFNCSIFKLVSDLLKRLPLLYEITQVPLHKDLIFLPRLILEHQ